MDGHGELLVKITDINYYGNDSVYLDLATNNLRSIFLIHDFEEQIVNAIKEYIELVTGYQVQSLEISPDTQKSFEIRLAFFDSNFFIRPD